MELTSFIKIFTLVIGMIAFVLMIAWVFQGATGEDDAERRPMRFLRLRRRKRTNGESTT